MKSSTINIFILTNLVLIISQIFQKIIQKELFQYSLLFQLIIYPMNIFLILESLFNYIWYPKSNFIKFPLIFEYFIVKHSFLLKFFSFHFESILTMNLKFIRILMFLLIKRLSLIFQFISLIIILPVF